MWVCHKTVGTSPTFILVVFTSFIFVATKCAAKTENYRRILSIQLGHLELFLSSCARRGPLFALSAILTFVQLPS